MVESEPTAAASWLPLLRLLQPIIVLATVAWVYLFDAAPESNTYTPTRRRTKALAATLFATTLTYFAAGILIILRAVIPSDAQRWTPELPLWHELDWQILLQIVSLATVYILLAWQQRQNGPGKYNVTPTYSAFAAGEVIDVITLILLGTNKPVESWDAVTPWSWAQVGLQIARIVFFWPILVSLLATSKAPQPSPERRAVETIAEERFAENSAAAAASAADRPQAQSTAVNERTALLRAEAGTGNYASTSAGAATESPGPSTGRNSPVSKPANGKPAGAVSSAASANASMGLTVSQTPPPPTLRVFVQRIIMLFPYLWPSESLKLQSLALLCVGLLIIGRFVNLAVPLLLGRIVDHLGGGPTADAVSIWWLIIGYAALKCLQGSGGILTVIQNFAWLPLQQYSDRQMSTMSFRHLLDLSMSFHTKRKTGEVLRILDRGASINTFFQYLIFSVSPIFFDISIATGFLSITFGPQVGVLLFVIMFFYTLVSVKMTTWRTGLRREANNKDSISRAIHTDVLLNWETVKSYNNEQYESERYRLALLEYQLAEWRVNVSLNILNMVQNLILSAGTLTMLFVVAYDIVHGYASSSDFVVFISYLSQIYGPLNMLSTLYRVINNSLADTDKLISLLQEEKDVKDIPGATELDVRQGVVEFRNVKFSYDGKTEALKGLSFTLKPKSKVALVGESGAGKSSVLRLLYRFYDPNSGQILIDGQDIRTVTQHSLRKAIGVVPQEAGLLNTSIKTNIGYGRTEPPATEEEIEAAAAAAQILDKIKTFPDGMDTTVGERGVRLSGGEKQRVAIARTFLKAPPILLLDEATSALDSQTEKQLQAALETLMLGKTSLTIAHRLSTIINSDQIIVLSDGKVIENGTHEELIAKPGGRYAAMWRAQIETDRERAEKEVKEKQARENGSGAEGPDSQGKAATAAAAAAATAVPEPIDTAAAMSQEPQEGMLGIVSPSKTDSEAMTSLGSASGATKETLSDDVDDEGSRPNAEDEADVTPAAASLQSIEAETLPAVARASSSDETQTRKEAETPAMTTPTPSAPSRGVRQPSITTTPSTSTSTSTTATTARPLSTLSSTRSAIAEADADDDGPSKSLSLSGRDSPNSSIHSSSGGTHTATPTTGKAAGGGGGGGEGGGSGGSKRKKKKFGSLIKRSTSASGSGSGSGSVSGSASASAQGTGTGTGSGSGSGTGKGK